MTMHRLQLPIQLQDFEWEAVTEAVRVAAGPEEVEATPLRRQHGRGWAQEKDLQMIPSCLE